MANNPLVYGSIQILSGKQAGTVFPISQPSVRIGRDPDQNDIILEDDNVSRSHARIMQTGSQWYIENLSRKSSISINITTPVVYNYPNPTAISNGDTICLGKATRVRFFIGFANQPLPNSGSASQPQNKTHRVGIPLLEISTNISKDTSAYQLFPPIINIGRDDSNDIIIDSLVVSSFHAQIKYEGNEIILIHPHPSAIKTTNGLLYQGHYIRGY